MAYDAHYPSQTSYHAPLYPFVNNSLSFYEASGCPKSKIIMGIPAFGRSYTLAEPGKTGEGSPVAGPGSPGPYTQAAGFLGFNEICERQKAGGWIEVTSPTKGGAYTWKDDQWISYDNINTVMQKVGW